MNMIRLRGGQSQQGFGRTGHIDLGSHGVVAYESADAAEGVEGCIQPVPHDGWFIRGAPLYSDRRARSLDGWMREVGRCCELLGRQKASPVAHSAESQHGGAAGNKLAAG